MWFTVLSEIWSNIKKMGHENKAKTGKSAQVLKCEIRRKIDKMGVF
jgi:hypothetical protein